jgi:hypothetical protein
MITKQNAAGKITNDSGYYVLRVITEVQITKQDAHEIYEQKRIDRFMDEEEQTGRSYAEQRYDEELYDAIRDGRAKSEVIAPTNLNVMGI